MGKYEKQFIFVMGGLMMSLIVVASVASIATRDWTPIIGVGIAVVMSGAVLTLVFVLDTIAKKIWRDDNDER